jgi:L-lactate permease
MQTWEQMYTPLGSLGLSALVALIPIIFFFIALAVFRMKGYIAGTITLVLSILVATLAYDMPLDMAFAAAGYGFAYGLWPIAWIIVAAVFLYKLTVKSGQFEVIRSSVLSITDDQRLQVLLIGFSFGLSSKVRPASARQWRSPPPCLWAGFQSAVRRGCA